MIRAGSLYFALFISFIVTLLLGSIILFSYYSNRYTDIQVLRDQVEANSMSGITLALYDTSLLAPGRTIVYDLYQEDDSIDDITISKTYWGVYQIIKSIAQLRNFKVIKTVLTGTDLATTEPIALYVADKDQYLSFSGNTSITGTCYFPKLGVRMAYIEGQSFYGEELVRGEIKTSKSELPSIHTSVISSNLAYFKDTIPLEDSLLSIDEIGNNDSLERSFIQSTIVLYSNQAITLDYVILKGNIRILSSKAIYVTANTSLDNIILYAPVIYFEPGFKGNLQAFANDTMIAGVDCEFTYPSCLGLINENINGIYLELKENTSLEGCIFIYQKNQASNKPYLKLDKLTRIHGQVYCQGHVELNGVIEGSLYCNGFKLKTSAGLYENYLLNATINRSALSEYLAGSFLFSGFQYAKSIQWVN